MEARLHHSGWFSLKSLSLPFAITLVMGLVPVRGATVTWTGLAGDDNWNSSANWSNPPGNPPNFMDDAIVGAPAPTVLNVNGLIQTLEVEDDGLINMLGGNDLTITNGTLTNFGEIVVNSDVADLLSSINFNIATTIDGKGTIQLNRHFSPGTPPFTIDRGATIESSSLVTQNAKHVIQGQGRINAPLLNLGTVRSFNPAGTGFPLTLVLAGTQQTNHNLFSSTVASKLEIITPLITQNASGQIVADTGDVTLDGTKIIGGSLKSSGGGEISVVGTSGARLQDVVNEATVNASFFLGIEGAGFTNNGVINAGTLRFDDSMTLGGTGQVVLETSASSFQTLSPAVVTQGPNHTIRGRGTISAALVNDGVIEATSTIGVLTLNAFTKTNNNLMQALASTTLDVATGLTIDQHPTTGRILAEDGTVMFNTSTGLNQGRLETTGTGRIEVRGTVTFTDVTIDGDVNVRAGPTVQLQIQGSSLTNDGLVTVNPSTSNTFHTVLFDGLSSMTLSGTGEILLNHTEHRAQINVATGKTLTQENGHKITGRGEINGDFVNNGDIEGDGASNLIDVNDTLSGFGSLEDVRINGTHAIGLGTVMAVPAFGLYEVDDAATVEFEIGGTHVNLFDRLLSQDTVDLDGTLSIEQIDPGGGVFQPQLGDMFEIISAVTVNNQFDTVTTSGLLPALDYDVIYASNSVTLKAVRKYSADFDFDGDVDDADLTKWETGYGTATGAVHMDGDADEDGDVDGDDFLLWQVQHGSGVGPIVAPTAVPEPMTLGLLLCGLLGLIVLPRPLHDRA